jgi:hypothetical protein
MADMTDPHIQAAAEALESDLKRRTLPPDPFGVFQGWRLSPQEIVTTAVRAWLASVGMMSSEFERKWTVDELGQAFDAWADAVRAVEQA